MCICVNVFGATEARGGGGILWNWSYGLLGHALHGCWDLNFSLLEKQEVLLTLEAFPSP